MLMTVGIFAVVKLLALLRRTVQGHLPVDQLGMIFTFKLATFLDVILTPAIYLAIMFMLMRWNRDNEITIYATGGLGPLSYLRPAAGVAAIATLIVAVLSLYVTPAAELGYHHELEKFRLLHKSAPFKSGEFRQFEPGQNVLYYGHRTADESDPIRLFYLRTFEQGQSITVADRGSYEFDLTDGVEKIQIHNGAQYWIEKDTLAVQVTRFETFTDRTPVAAFSATTIQAKAKPTAQLIASDQPADQAELHWRITKILAMALTVMLAFAWGSVASRSRMNINFVAAILVYFVYSSLLGFCSAQMRDGELSPGWVSESPHLAMIALIFAMVARQYFIRPFGSIIATKRV